MINQIEFILFFFSIKPLSNTSFNLRCLNLFFFSCLCRECEGCGGEEGEAVAEEESQTGDQRRQDGEQSLGEFCAAFKLLLY